MKAEAVLLWAAVGSVGSVILSNLTAMVIALRASRRGAEVKMKSEIPSLTRVSWEIGETRHDDEDTNIASVPQNQETRRDAKN